MGTVGRLTFLACPEQSSTSSAFSNKSLAHKFYYFFIVIVSIVIQVSYLKDNSVGSFANLFDFQEIFNFWHFAQYSWFFTSWMLCGHIHFECWILSTLNQLQMNSTRLLLASSSRFLISDLILIQKILETFFIF